METIHQKSCLTSHHVGDKTNGLLYQRGKRNRRIHINHQRRKLFFRRRFHSHAHQVAANYARIVHADTQTRLDAGRHINYLAAAQNLDRLAQHAAECRNDRANNCAGNLARITSAQTKNAVYPEGVLLRRLPCLGCNMRNHTQIALSVKAPQCDG